MYVYVYMLIPRNNPNKYIGLEHWNIEKEIKDSPWLHTEKEHDLGQAQLSTMFNRSAFPCFLLSQSLYSSFL